ncbi:peptide chain release factor N(5)-glutamine methyltransferase [Actinomyces radicidentis]|uniref:peptide chain release factor N(5)-glutamine methyltransferase n=1 Tax=Actinomyces radicidentis TaxID=111015 RepID=UPI0028EE47B5|nr:peptide chain release factor N(5)-glutamine methyltransferase [Actinomyces radicidentis]
MDRYGLRRLVTEVGGRLAEAGVASPEVDARVLAEHVVGRALVMADGASAEQVELYLALVERRAAREPLQLITGTMWFRGLELTARPGVFIVRPETEVVAQAAVDAARAARAVGTAEPVVVDLCTGSGAIAAALALEVPEARVTAVELDDAPAALAAENLERLSPGRVRLVQADATAPETLAELDGAVDVVVSNPPYVPADAVEDDETERYDPDLALYGGGVDGLAVPVAVIGRAAALLRPGGVLVMEHDAGQGAALREAALAAGFASASTGQDLTGRDRYLRAVR